MDINEAINYIFEGQALLFTGSGFSFGATSAAGIIPSAGSLSNILDEQTGEDSNGDLGEAADAYIEKNGENQLVSLIKTHFCCKATTHAQDVISKQKWLRIYTTNYDDIVEIGGRKANLPRHTVTLADRVHDFKDLRNQVIHLNGSVDNLTPEKLYNEFKLTNASYLTRDFQDSEWVDLFQYDLKDAQAILFVGFSMKYDLDIKRVVAQEAFRDKTFFIVWHQESPKNIRQLEKFGIVLPISTEGFATKIEEAAKNYVPPTTVLTPPLLCFNKYSRNYVRQEIKDQDVFDLFLHGIVSDNLVCYSINEPKSYPYYVYREKLDFAFKLIENGCRRLVIHSDLGNGKTLFIKGLSIMLSKSGYDVYEFKRDEVSMERELDTICNIKGNRTVIVLENYSSYKNVLKYLKLRCTDQILLFTERSVKNDMAIDSLEKDFGETREIDLNVLTELEAERLNAVLNQYGLWGVSSTLRDDQKLDLIRRKYKGSLCSVLLDIMNSPSIIGRFQSEIGKIKRGSSLFQVLIMILVSKYLELNMDVDMLAVAIDDDLLGSTSYRRNEVMKEFVDFSSLEIRVRSSIFSEALLKNVIDATSISEVLIKAFKRINKHQSESKYRRVLFSLLSSSNLIRLLDRKGEDNQNLLINFFEKIRDCEFCKSNPHYWLQYAIIKLKEPNYEVAKKLFENAYAFAKKKTDFDPYQIDNHYARYLLENSINNIDDPEYMKTITQVQDILTEPGHLKRTKYYPFRVARNYYSFYEKYKAKMSKKEKQQMSAFSMKLLTMITIYKKSTPAYSHRWDVKDAENGLEAIVADINGDQSIK